MSRQSGLAVVRRSLSLALRVRQPTHQSDTQAALALEAPFDPAARVLLACCYALTQTLLQRRAPGHELKPHSVFDHREPAGGQGDPLAADAGDVLAFGGRAMSGPWPRGPLRRSRRRSARIASRVGGGRSSGAWRRDPPSIMAEAVTFSSSCRPRSTSTRYR